MLFFRRRGRILRLAYLLVIAAAAYGLYRLIPKDVWRTLHDTYVHPDAGAQP